MILGFSTSHLYWSTFWTEILNFFVRWFLRGLNFREYLAHFIPFAFTLRIFQDLIILAELVDLFSGELRAAFAALLFQYCLTAFLPPFVGDIVNFLASTLFPAIQVNPLTLIKLALRTLQNIFKCLVWKVMFEQVAYVFLRSFAISEWNDWFLDYLTDLGR